MNFIKHQVLKYYQLVDSQDYPSMYQLFSSDAVYQRCEQTISGMDEFKHFYEHERSIIGKHSLITLIAQDKTVAVRGVFIGKNKENQSIKLEFADFFEFNATGKITKRTTYLATGYQSTT